MRIVYMLTSLGVGGAERQVLALARRMSARGHTVQFITLRPRLDGELSCELSVFRLEMHRTPWSVLRGLVRCARFLHGFRPDVVHSHGFHGNMIARMLRPFAPAQITTIHNVYEGGWLRMLAYRLTDGLSRRTIAVSQAAADSFIAMKAVPRARISVLTNGIDADEFAPDSARRQRMRAASSVTDAFVWFTAGRIVPAKDYPNLLRAFALVRAEIAATQLWIAGNTPKESSGTGAAIAPLNALAAELGLADAVHWLGLRDDMPALLDAADGFVLASAWEGLPLVLGEAMAMEKPVAATDVGGVRELAGDACELIQAHDPRALGRAMLRVMRMPAEERSAMGAQARRRIVERFSIDARANSWEDIYREALK